MKIDCSDRACWPGVESPWVFIWNQIWTNKTPQWLKLVSKAFVAGQASSMWHQVFAGRLFILLHKFLLCLDIVTDSGQINPESDSVLPRTGTPSCGITASLCAYGNACFHFCFLGLAQVFIAACGRMKCILNCILERWEFKFIKHLMLVYLWEGRECRQKTWVWH